MFRLLYDISREGLTVQSYEPLRKEAVMEIIQFIRDQGFLEKGRQNYDSRNNLRGYLCTAKNNKNENLMIVSVMGGQVSDDTYPLYDILLQGEPGNITGFKLLNKYYEDVAGFEGFRFYFIAIVLSVLSGLITTVLLIIIKIFRFIFQKKPVIVAN